MNTFAKKHFDSQPSVFFIGIGGIGMSSLARWFLASGWQVSGSDLAATDITKSLEEQGVLISIGHSPSHIERHKGIDLIVRSQAVPLDHPEFLAAKKLGIPVFTYPEVIGALSRNFETIAIAGAHGKSTTTALAALTFLKAGLDPTVIFGTQLKELPQRNFHSGSSRYLILEADEYGRAFLHYSPSHLIVTNIDREHLDIYRDLKDIQETFLKLIRSVRQGGVVVLNKDSKSLRALASKVEHIAQEKKLRVLWVSLSSPDAKRVQRVLNLPGDHNLSNALLVYSLVKQLKISEKSFREIASTFSGPWRRLELRGNYFGAPVYDDYAHHPTEIRAALIALKKKFPGRELVCVFQPHQKKRLQALFSEFQNAFVDADITLISPEYRVSGRDEEEESLAEDLVRTIQKKNPKKRLFYLANLTNLLPAFESFGDSSTWKNRVVVMMGAGDIYLKTSLLLNK